MTANLESNPPSGTRLTASDVASWQPCAEAALRLRKNKASDSEILSVSKQLARLAGTAALAQSQGATTPQADPQIAFTRALSACSLG